MTAGKLANDGPFRAAVKPAFLHRPRWIAPPPVPVLGTLSLLLFRARASAGGRTLTDILGRQFAPSLAP